MHPTGIVCSATPGEVRLPTIRRSGTSQNKKPTDKGRLTTYTNLSDMLQISRRKETAYGAGSYQNKTPVQMFFLSFSVNATRASSATEIKSAFG
jgi:hypothetical protein